MKATTIFNGNGSNDKELPDYISKLSQDCLRMVMKLTSPKDVCRSAVVCTTFHLLLDSDDMWDHFLPSDLSSILSRAEMDDNQLPLKKKDLYLHLCHNWICLDGGLKSFRLDLSTGAKKIMLPAKSLLIVDSRETRIPVFWINGTIDCKNLSRERNYAAYLIFTGIRYSGRRVNHDLQDNEQHYINVINFILRFCNDMSRGGSPPSIYRKCENGVWHESRMREDGRWEIKLGNFSTHFQREDRQLSVYFFDIGTILLKSELTVTGVEVRPED